MNHPRCIPHLAAATLALACASAVAHDRDDRDDRDRPLRLRGPVQETVYDGVTNDLLTGGLGKTGLMGATPAFAIPAVPTAAELRRNAIYVNYRALVDALPAGGMGRFYGPNIDANGNDTLGEGKVAGREYIAWLDDGTGRENVTLMVQVPDSFDPNAACIVTATSSGSRGIYGAIGSAGDWGLKRGCAVAYTDKGSGNGFHDLMTGDVTLRDGTRVNAAVAGTESLFTANVSGADLAAFNAVAPNRVAYKHAHSQRNPEQDWGQHTLAAVRFAFQVLNQRYGGGITKRHTIVIASSVSNGGGAALAAAEQDEDGLIDGVAVSEPNAQPRHPQGLRIRQGSTEIETVGRPLLDYFTFANVYQPCASLAAGLSVSPVFWPAIFTNFAQNRCASLAAKGLVSGATLAEQSASALAAMRAYGWQAESDFLQQSHYRFATNSIAVTYTNAYGRFSVLDRACGFSFANTDASGSPAPQAPNTQAALFATGNGVPPTSGINIVYDDSAGGPKLDFLGVSPSTGASDFSLDGALCQRSLATGRDAVTGAPLTGAAKAQSERVRDGVRDVLLDGKLRKPTIIVAGRNDTLVPVNHAARAYYAATQRHDRHDDKVRYIEVTNAQHFDSFITLSAFLGYDARFIPLHVYFVRAMDAMWAHLKHGAPLPQSQVVRTVPRGGTPGAAPALAAGNVPPIAAVPAAGDAITMQGRTLRVPD
jgi:hydroxybutyrate-dimer hydrolase